MIELETAAIAALLLLADMVCSGIAAWRGNPQLSVISGSATSAGATLVVGSLILPITASAIIAAAVAFLLPLTEN
ncbi:hypothetical protein [Stutzerimonas kunmingensis]|jgi:uncharacterized membrane protein YjjP (DUF1212 family)|uniref:hypothetical protein n=1 Tax=Stutzerimonas kunmingensis TaxID=1211807 RepID=UPI000ECE7C7E|nr:hypothetical protein [Stutzerimonas kunmingensis]HCH78859.1 hypothetical protein [Pseudomonas sp.]|tara:strand:- start:24 stop:248 length:225 start_codon:yes stop_codon:yes gene_type:complete